MMIMLLFQFYILLIILLSRNWCIKQRQYKFLHFRFFEPDESCHAFSSKKKEYLCLVDGIDSLMIIIFGWKTGGVNVVLPGDESFVRWIHQIEMVMAGHEPLLKDKIELL